MESSEKEASLVRLKNENIGTDSNGRITVLVLKGSLDEDPVITIEKLHYTDWSVNSNLDRS